METIAHSTICHVIAISSTHGNVMNPQGACAARVTEIGLGVCVSVTQHLTFRVFLHATNDTNPLGCG